MTSVIDKKTKRIDGRSALDQKNFILKFIKTRYSLKAEQNMYYLISKKNSEYTHKELKKHNKINNACESLKKFRNTNKIYKSCEKTINMNEIQNLECNEHH